MKIARIGLCATICCLTVLSFGMFSSVAHPRSTLSSRVQSRLVGASGTSMKCTGTATCMACTPTTGCTTMAGWLGTPITGYCSCTTAGMSGCSTAAAFTVCAPTPSASCAAGTPACGTFDSPVTPVATMVGGAWTCPATPCATGAAGSAYCVNCI